jgi:hypothetical protein
MKQTRLDQLPPDLIRRLQVTVGNRAVQRLIERRRQAQQIQQEPEPELQLIAAPVTALVPVRPAAWWRRTLARTGLRFRRTSELDS